MDVLETPPDSLSFPYVYEESFFVYFVKIYCNIGSFGLESI